MPEMRKEMPAILQAVIFKNIPGFRDWILTTKLFHAIVQYSGNPAVNINAFANDETLSLFLNDKRISTPEELPIELLIKFYDNYPDRPDSPMSIGTDNATIIIDNSYNKPKP